MPKIQMLEKLLEHIPQVFAGAFSVVIPMDYQDFHNQSSARVHPRLQQQCLAALLLYLNQKGHLSSNQTETTMYERFVRQEPTQLPSGIDFASTILGDLTRQSDYEYDSTNNPIERSLATGTDMLYGWAAVILDQPYSHNTAPMQEDMEHVRTSLNASPTAIEQPDPAIPLPVLSPSAADFRREPQSFPYSPLVLSTLAVEARGDSVSPCPLEHFPTYIAPISLEPGMVLTSGFRVPPVLPPNARKPPADSD